LLDQEIEKPVDAELGLRGCLALAAIKVYGKLEHTVCPFNDGAGCVRMGAGQQCVVLYGRTTVGMQEACSWYPGKVIDLPPATDIHLDATRSAQAAGATLGAMTVLEDGLPSAR
jgi:hypothetical protein